MMIKIFGMGFLLNNKAYLRDYWNILDFIIVTTSYIPIIVKSSTVNLASLRSLRILRPLRTISSIKSLRRLLVTLFSSLKLLIESLIILMFFYMIFAIAGLQLFSGVLKKRCFHEEKGIELIDNYIKKNIFFCIENTDCKKKDYICGKLIENPNWGLTNFDTFIYAFLQVKEIISNHC